MPTREQLVGTIAIVLLLVGFGGILSTRIEPQNLNILLLPMLAVAIFMANQYEVLDQRIFHGIGNLRYLFYLALVIGFPFYIVANPGSWVPIYTAALAVGLALANWMFRRTL